MSLFPPEIFHLISNLNVPFGIPASSFPNLSFAGLLRKCQPSPQALWRGREAVGCLTGSLGWQRVLSIPSPQQIYPKELNQPQSVPQLMGSPVTAKGERRHTAVCPSGTISSALNTTVSPGAGWHCPVLSHPTARELLDMGSVTVSPRGAAGQVRLSVCHKKLFSHRVLVCNNSSPKSLLPQLRSGIFSQQQTLHEVLGPAAGQGLGAAVSCPTTHPGEQRAEPWLHVQGAQSPSLMMDSQK